MQRGAKGKAIRLAKSSTRLTAKIKNTREFSRTLKRLRGINNYIIQVKLHPDPEVEYVKHVIDFGDNLTPRAHNLLGTIATHLLGIHYRFEKVFIKSTDEPTGTMVLIGPKTECQLMDYLARFLVKAIRVTVESMVDEHKRLAKNKRARERYNKTQKKKLDRSETYGYKLKSKLWTITEHKVYSEINFINKSYPQLRIKNYFSLKDTRIYIQRKYGEIQS